MYLGREDTGRFEEKEKVRARKEVEVLPSTTKEAGLLAESEDGLGSLRTMQDWNTFYEERQIGLATDFLLLLFFKSEWRVQLEWRS